MYYRYECYIDGAWYGICNVASEFGRLGCRLEECGLFEPHFEFAYPCKCWFTDKGKKACEEVIKEISSELTCKTRCLCRKDLKGIKYRDDMQVICKVDSAPVYEDFVPCKRYTKKLHIYIEDWETEQKTFLFTEISGNRYDFETLYEGFKSYMEVNGKKEDISLDTSYYECVPYMFCDYEGEWFDAKEYIVDAEQIPGVKRKLSNMYNEMKVALVKGNISQADMYKIKFFLNQQK